MIERLCARCGEEQTGVVCSTHPEAQVNPYVTVLFMLVMFNWGAAYAATPQQNRSARFCYLSAAALTAVAAILYLSL